MIKNLPEKFLISKKGYLKSFLLSTIVLCAGIAGVLAQDSTFRYHIGTTAPDANWRDVGFDDSSWPIGMGSIGYGDGDDSINTGPTPSIYGRYRLTATPDDLTNLKALILYADFDDGYIAYINGKEVLRVNMDPNLTNPTNTDVTIRSHEAELYRDAYRPTLGYYISAALLDSCGFDGENTLAIEVHNDSINGSDLSFAFDYSFYNDYFNYDFYWPECRFTQKVPIDSMDIPIIIIETGEYGFSYDTNSVAWMGIINNGPGQYNKLTDPFTEYNGRISLGGRGATSQDFPKVQLKFELQDSLGDNNNVSILGMPAENDFILYGPFPDQSLIRNEIIFGLGRSMNYYVPRTRPCELILNGRDLGFYFMTEKIKQDADRVDIANLTSSDNSGLDVTGGYIFKYDKGPSGIQMEYPDPDDITYEQSNYFNGFMHTYDSVLNHDGFMDPYTGYRRYIDVESLADYVIINELSQNVDAYYFSCFMHKDRDDRGGLIQYGPLWDYDYSLGYSLWENLSTSYWRFNSSSKIPKIQLLRILQDTGFVDLLAERWHDARLSFLKTDSIFHYIDNLVDTLRPAIDHNYQVWAEYGQIYDFKWQITNDGATYDAEITNMKSWIAARLTWIDANIDKIYKPLVVYTGIEDITGNTRYAYCYPNPFIDQLMLSVDLKIPGDIRLEIYDVSGKKLKDFNYTVPYSGQSEFRVDIANIIEPGVYLVKVSKDNIPLMTQRVVKIK